MLVPPQPCTHSSVAYAGRCSRTAFRRAHTRAFFRSLTMTLTDDTLAYSDPHSDPIPHCASARNCGGASICQHHRERGYCKDCGGEEEEGLSTVYRE